MAGPRLIFGNETPLAAIGAGLTFDPLQSSIYRYLPWAAHIAIVAWTTATGVRLTVLAGSELLVPEHNIEFGAAAAGRLPRSGFDVTPIEFTAARGDLLQTIFRNTTAGTLTVSGFIDFHPA